MSNGTFSAIASRSFLLRGPAERTVIASVGTPEPDPEHPATFRCPFKVSGLSDDGVQYARGVDSFQALNLAFAGIRSVFTRNASVLAAFHKDFSLTWEGGPWELALPLNISSHDIGQLERLERFLAHAFWHKSSDADA